MFNSSLAGSSSTGISVLSATSGLATGAASAVLIASRFSFNLLISSFNPDKSATICCKRLLSTTVEFSGTFSTGSAVSTSAIFSSASASFLISFTTGADDVFSSPTERS